MTAKEKEKISPEIVEQPDNAPSESASARVLSNEDSVIADLIKEQPTMEQIERLTVTARRVPDLMAFPEEVLERHNKEYHFAWLAKNKDIAVKLRVSGWVLCNKTNSPWIKSHRFGSHGAVEQSGMLLAFMRKDIADAMYLRPALDSQNKVKYMTEDRFKQQDPKAPVSFYKPTDLSAADEPGDI